MKLLETDLLLKKKFKKKLIIFEGVDGGGMQI